MLQNRCLFRPEASNLKTSLGVSFLSLHSRKSMTFTGKETKWHKYTVSYCLVLGSPEVPDLD